MTPNLAELSVRLRSVNTEITDLNRQVKGLKEDKAEIEKSIFQAFDDLGCGANGIDTDAGHIGIKETIVANVDDWELFYEWLYQTKSGHMLERRVANIAFREMMELGEDVPGLEPFTKKTISLTKGKGG